MINLELIYSAWDGLRSHLLRSALTTLGIIFGVAAVIGMASIGEGARRQALQQIERMGVGNILINENRPEDGEEHDKAVEKNPKALTIADADAIHSVFSQLKSYDSNKISPVQTVPLRSNEVMVSGSGKRMKINAVSTTPKYFSLYGLELSSGRLLSWRDETDYRRVCVLGWEAGRKLFPLEDPLGRQIQIHGSTKHVFTVVGVIGRRTVGSGDIKGLDLRDENLDVYIPLQTALKRDPPGNSESELSQIIVKIPNPEQLTTYANVIKRMLDRRHHGIKDFEVIMPEELLRQHQETQRIFNIVMGTIASISLLVGGIGIMNIMLASVLERTREIGIRRAVGATERDIARQFLMEAVLLSLIGGIIGVIVGILLAYVITLYAEWETAVSVWVIFVAVGVSAGVGIIFGYLPARQAAKMDPITALRFE